MPISIPTTTDSASAGREHRPRSWCYVGVTTDNAALTMYTTTWCGYCKRLKMGLKTAGIEWVEIDIEQDPSAADFVGSVNGGNHVVPTVKFGDGSTATNPTVADVRKKLGV